MRIPPSRSSPPYTPVQAQTAHSAGPAARNTAESIRSFLRRNFASDETGPARATGAIRCSRSQSSGNSPRLNREHASITFAISPRATAASFAASTNLCKTAFPTARFVCPFCVPVSAWKVWCGKSGVRIPKNWRLKLRVDTAESFCYSTCLRCARQSPEYALIFTQLDSFTPESRKGARC